MNKELSLEEIAKPYLILAKVAQKQGKTDLKSIILDRMIESMSSTQEVELIPMSKLVGILNLNSVKEIKEEIEKAEKEIKYPVIDRHFKNFNNPVEVILNYIDKYYPTLYYAMYRDINPNGGLTKDIVTTYIKNKLSQTKPSLEEAIEVLCNALKDRDLFEDNGLKPQMLTTKKLEILKTIANLMRIDWDEVVQDDKIISLELKLFKSIN